MLEGGSIGVAELESMCADVRAARAHARAAPADVGAAHTGRGWVTYSIPMVVFDFSLVLIQFPFC